jgi:hypothetical protein
MKKAEEAEEKEEQKIRMAAFSASISGKMAEKRHFDCEIATSF